VGNPFIEEEDENISDIPLSEHKEVLHLNMHPNPSFYVGERR